MTSHTDLGHHGPLLFREREMRTKRGRTKKTFCDHSILCPVLTVNIFSSPFLLYPALSCYFGVILICLQTCPGFYPCQASHLIAFLRCQLVFLSQIAKIIITGGYYLHCHFVFPRAHGQDGCLKVDTLSNMFEERGKQKAPSSFSFNEHGNDKFCDVEHLMRGISLASEKLKRIC